MVPHDGQNPQNQGESLNAAADAVQDIKAFEITVDSLAGDYKDAHFIARDGPNIDTAFKIREQAARNMRVFQVNNLRLNNLKTNLTTIL